MELKYDNCRTISVQIISAIPVLWVSPGTTMTNKANVEYSEPRGTCHFDRNTFLAEGNSKSWSKSCLRSRGEVVVVAAAAGETW